MARSSAAAASKMVTSPVRASRRPVTPGDACEGFTLARNDSIPTVEETGRICAGIVCPPAFDAERIEHFTEVLTGAIARGRR